MRPSLVEIYLIKFQTMLMNGNQVQNIALQNWRSVELKDTELSSFLNSCKEVGIELEDFEDLFLDISDAVTDQTHDEALSRDLKIKLFFLRHLNFYFKSMLHPLD